MKFATLRCLENDDLFHYIVNYLFLLDLLRLEPVSRRFQRLIQFHYDQWLRHEEYEYLWFKKNSSYSSKKERMCNLINNRRSYRQGFVLYGGNFGSPCHLSEWIDDNPYELSGHFLRRLRNNDALGSVAACCDSKNQLHIIGGWKEFTEETLNTATVWNLTTFESQTSTIDQPRCFAAASANISGDIIVCGGGDSPYRGATVESSCIFKPCNSDTWLTDVIAPMQIRRCGHQSVIYLNGQLYVFGGYSGESDYCETVEFYDWSRNKWFAAPSMQCKRSGSVAVLGPHGSMYLCGGSTNGSYGNKTMERYDPREGKWQFLSSMYRGRGYTSGAMGATGILYVCGGLDDTAAFQGGIECYDFRNDRWYGLASSNAEDRTGSECFPTEEIPLTSTVFPKRKVNATVSPILSASLIRASHQMVYMER